MRKDNLEKLISDKANTLFGIVMFLVIILLCLAIAHFIYSETITVESIAEASKAYIIPCIAIIAALITFLAFYAQIMANKKIQDQFLTQQFESQFFEMLRLHKENIKEMKITGYGRLLKYKFGEYKEMDFGDFDQATSTDLTQYVRYIENRKVFVNMNVELIACINLITDKYKELNNTKKLQDKENQAILKLSYKIFFFGSKSELIHCDKNIISKDYIIKIKDHLNTIRNKHKETFGDKNSFGNNKTTIYIKYRPFSGHENRLGHYYRHLYAMVKYVVQKENEGFFDYAKSREYLKLLRSQMSNDEQLMLYYNFLLGYGENWDSNKSSIINQQENKKLTKGEKNQFFTKYRMLHNLPIDRIDNKIESPRNYFKKYILEIQDFDKVEGHKLHDDDDLFEW
jgi:hypothetical protein